MKCNVYSRPERSNRGSLTQYRTFNLRLMVSCLNDTFGEVHFSGRLEGPVGSKVKSAKTRVGPEIRLDVISSSPMSGLPGGRGMLKSCAHLKELRSPSQELRAAITKLCRVPESCAGFSKVALLVSNFARIPQKSSRKDLLIAVFLAWVYEAIRRLQRTQERQAPSQTRPILPSVTLLAQLQARGYDWDPPIFKGCIFKSSRFSLFGCILPPVRLLLKRASRDESQVEFSCIRVYKRVTGIGIVRERVVRLDEMKGKASKSTREVLQESTDWE
ncbi:hypothetical protein FA13DRAFT_1714193 [Coprinellus micaceus]|uniref:Uncharacterized protein n=1 Tax=Coprinellus micaceus TaxID=71717 RepID=A0A4Y7STZ0_COPMI|nr:hypothetical protein FA13DRAFT_1714193 [Coprinellus micaceus]